MILVDMHISFLNAIRYYVDFQISDKGVMS